MSVSSRTVYSVAYRQVSRATLTSHFYPECCPGWKRFHSHNCNQGMFRYIFFFFFLHFHVHIGSFPYFMIFLFNMYIALCIQTCLNGGTCYKPNQCACPLGWRGHQCQKGNHPNAFYHNFNQHATQF